MRVRRIRQRFFITFSLPYFIITRRLFHPVPPPPLQVFRPDPLSAGGRPQPVQRLSPEQAVVRQHLLRAARRVPRG